MIEKLARACFARLCPWIAKEYPDFPVEKSTTMTAYIEGYTAATGLRYGTKSYSYKHTSRKSWYMTINDVQVFGYCSSEREVLEAIERLKRGEKP